MVIVKLTECLKNLSGVVINKIANKQDEVTGTVDKRCLEQRLLDINYQQKLYERLSDVEKRFFVPFLRKFAYFELNNIKEHNFSTEEKLALLLLRQKGLLYKIDMNSSHSYIFPEEIVSGYYEQTFPLAVQELEQMPIGTKKYLYVLFEVLMFVKKNKPTTIADFDLTNTGISKSVDLKMIIKFLEEYNLIIKDKQWRVNDKNCDLFFKNEVVNKSLLHFCLNYYIRDRFVVSFFSWALLGLTDNKAISIDELYNFVADYENIDIVSEALQWLTILELIYIKEDGLLYLCNSARIDGQQTYKGIETGMLQFFVPVFINEQHLWTIRNWGVVLSWEEMVHLSFTHDSISSALTHINDFPTLINSLKELLPEHTVADWQALLKKWLIENKPIEKKTDVTFYSVSQKLHLSYIKEYWNNWHEVCSNGIIIEKEKEEELEKLLEQLSLQINENQAHHNNELKVEIAVVDDYPQMSSTIPEVDKLPKQWFVPTSYEDKTMLRIIKQAIVLQLSIKIKTNKGLEIFIPKKVAINQGYYEISSDQNKKIKFKEVLKLSVVHPFNE